MSGEHVVGKRRGAVMTAGGTNFVLARGLVTMTTSPQVVVTGLKNVIAAIASLEDDPVTGVPGGRIIRADVTAVPGEISFRATDSAGTNATSFGSGGLDVSWIAIGTA